MNKYQEIYQNRINGNLSEYSKQINKLTKIQLLEYIIYISEVTQLSAFQILDHVYNLIKK